MPRQHACLACGFLTVQGRELNATERQALAGEQAPADAVHLRCHLELWDELSLDGSLANVRHETKTERTCAGHLTYAPGQSPKDHLVTSVQRQRRRQWRPQWMAATLAGVLLVVGALLARSCMS